MRPNDFTLDLVSNLSFQNGSSHRLLSPECECYSAAIHASLYLSAIGSSISCSDLAFFKTIRSSIACDCSVQGLSRRQVYSRICQHISRLSESIASTLVTALSSDLKSFKPRIAVLLPKYFNSLLSSFECAELCIISICYLQNSHCGQLSQQDISLSLQILRTLCVSDTNDSLQCYLFRVSTGRDLLEKDRLPSDESFAYGSASAYIGHTKLLNINHIDGLGHYAFGHQLLHLSSRRLLNHFNVSSSVSCPAVLAANQFLLAIEAECFPDNLDFDGTKLLNSIFQGTYTGLLNLGGTFSMENLRVDMLSSNIDLSIFDRAIYKLLPFVSQFVPKLPSRYVALYARTSKFKNEHTINFNYDRNPDHLATEAIINYLIKRSIHVVVVGDCADDLDIQSPFLIRYSRSLGANDVGDILIAQKAMFLIFGGRSGATYLGSFLDKYSFHYNSPINRPVAYDRKSYVVPWLYSICGDSSMPLSSVPIIHDGHWFERSDVRLESQPLSVLLFHLQNFICYALGNYSYAPTPSYIHPGHFETPIMIPSELL